MSLSIANTVANRLSLRQPQRESLELLAEACNLLPLEKGADVAAALKSIQSKYPRIEDFERDFPSLCFALATGVGKTRLMGAFISYLYKAEGIRHFFVLAPNLTITKTADATPVNSTDPIGFTIVVKNTGTGSAYTVNVNDPLPAPSGITWSNVTTTAGYPVATLSSNTVSDILGTLAAGATVTIHVTGVFEFDDAGKISNWREYFDMKEIEAQFAA